MDDLETTNGRLARVLEDVRQLIEWADGDVEFSREIGGARSHQARDDFRRATALRSALTLLQGCER